MAFGSNAVARCVCGGEVFTVNDGDDIQWNERVDLDDTGSTIVMNGGHLTINGDLKFPDNDNGWTKIIMHGGLFEVQDTESIKERQSHLEMGAGTFRTCNIGGGCRRDPRDSGCWDIYPIDGCTGINFEVDGNCVIVTADCGPSCDDADSDGVCDDQDNCVNTSNAGQENSDSDSYGNACDNCADVDNEDQADDDGDDVGNECDGCPGDSGKIEAGICGCGVADTDSDGDGTPDCNDGCPGDPNKTAPGVCDCGTADDDTDGDGVEDCIDNCPEVPNADQTDNNGNGVGDVCESGPDFHLNVDIGPEGQPVETDWEEFNGGHVVGAETRTYNVDGTNIDVTISIGNDNDAGYRNYGGGVLGGDMVYPDDASTNGPVDGSVILAFGNLICTALLM